MSDQCCEPARTDCKPNVVVRNVCLALQPDGNSKIRATKTTTVAADCTETVEYVAFVGTYNPLTTYSQADEVPCGSGELIPFAPLAGGGSGGGGGGLTNSELRASPVNVSSGSDLIAKESTQSANGVLLASTNTTIGATTDTAATTDTGTFSLLAFVKRGLQRWTALLALLPTSLGQKTSATSFAVVLASDQPALSITSGSATATAITVLNAATAVGAGTPVTTIPKGVRTWMLYGTTTSGSGTATVIVDGSPDGTNWTPVGPMTLTLTTSGASTPDANTTSFTDQSSFVQYRGRIPAAGITGTGAAVTLKVSV